LMVSSAKLAVDVKSVASSTTIECKRKPIKSSHVP
jgi:hypothetical protein